MADSNDQELELEEERQLDPEVAARRNSALKVVRKYGDPILRTEALAVTDFDSDLASQVEGMISLMDDALGIGLAANQVGSLRRVLTYRVDPEAEAVALINPVIDGYSDELEPFEEGCLSLPGVHVEVERPVSIKVRAQDVNGGPLEFEAHELEARVIQHELDHLNGVLILDRCSRQERKEAIRTLREELG